MEKTPYFASGMVLAMLATPPAIDGAKRLNDYLNNSQPIIEQVAEVSSVLSNLEKMLGAVAYADGQSNTEISYSLWKVGNDAYHRGDLNEAKKKYNDAIRIDPHNPLYYNDLGVVYADEKNWELAINNYKKAIVMGSKGLKPITYFNLAKSLKFLANKNMGKGDLKKAKALYQEAYANYQIFLGSNPEGDEKITSENSLRVIENTLSKIQ